MELRLGPLCRWANRALAIRAGGVAKVSWVSQRMGEVPLTLPSAARSANGVHRSGTGQCVRCTSGSRHHRCSTEVLGFFCQKLPAMRRRASGRPAHRNDEIERPANPQAKLWPLLAGLLVHHVAKKDTCFSADRRCELKDLQTIMHWDKRETVTR